MLYFKAENAMRVEEKEFGVVLWDKFNLNEEIIHKALMPVLTDERQDEI